MNMKIVMPCAKSKYPIEGGDYIRFMRDKYGKPVIFVDNPKQAPKSRNLRYVSPTCNYDDNMTFQDRLRSYNDEFMSDGYNPFNLLPAYKLYAIPIYEALVRSEKYGKDGVYILAAPWGIVRADFLLPMYDLTFSEVEKYKKRAQDDTYKNKDFCHLNNNSNETLSFIGINKYIKPFYRLTQKYSGKRVIYFNSEFPYNSYKDVEFVKCARVKKGRKWHYQCARKKLNSCCDCTQVEARI